MDGDGLRIRNASEFIANFICFPSVVNSSTLHEFDSVRASVFEDASRRDSEGHHRAGGNSSNLGFKSRETTDGHGLHG